jgi:hypothetical protein
MLKKFVSKNNLHIGSSEKWPFSSDNYSLLNSGSRSKSEFFFRNRFRTQNSLFPAFDALAKRHLLQQYIDVFETLLNFRLFQ